MLWMKVVVYSLVILVCSTLYADEGEGGIAGNFLRYGVGGRALAMGRAYSAFAEGSDAVYWNPAGLGGLLRWELEFMYSPLYLDSHYSFASFAYPIGKDGALSLAYVGLMNTGLEQRDEANTYLGDFSTNNWAVMLGYGRYLFQKQVRLGLGTKFIYESVADNSAGGFGGIQLGVISRDFFRKLRFALMVDGLGTAKIAEDEYPITLRCGLMYRPFRNLYLTADVDIVPDVTPMPKFGLEYKLSRAFYLRAGTSIDEFTAGFGWSFRGLSLAVTELGFGGGEAAVDYAAGFGTPVGYDVGRVSLTFRGKERISIKELQAVADPCEKLSEYAVLLDKEGAPGAAANLTFGYCLFRYQSLEAPLKAKPDFEEANFHFREAYLGKYGGNWKEEIVTNEAAKKLFSQKTHYMFAESELHSKPANEEMEQLIKDLIFVGGDSIQYDPRLQFDLAYLYELLGKTDSAVSVYKDLIELEGNPPEKIMAYYRLANIYKNSSPDDAIVYLTPLITRYQKGFYDEEHNREEYPMFPKFNDNNPFDDALLMAGDILRTSGGEANLVKASEYYMNVLLLCPDLNQENLRLARERLADVYDQLGKGEIANKLRQGGL